ncbi:uncharacterized protein K452DRAFT_296497, partial [Aplosporella prunicola CBS 121167]
MADLDDAMQLPTAASSSAAHDVDLSDETQDFRFLSALSTAENGTTKLPRRGEKDFEPHATALQSSALASSRAAMHAAISCPRVHNPKNHIRATYDAGANMAWVDSVKGQVFRTMGRVVGGRMWLLPEEALYLLERGSLDIRWPAGDGDEDGGESGDDEEHVDAKDGLPMSLQGAYAAFIGLEPQLGGKLTLERYIVYAGLKRAGYIVTRADGWDGAKTLDTTHGNAGGGTSSGVFAGLWKILRGGATKASSAAAVAGPLVAPGLYRKY